MSGPANPTEVHFDKGGWGFDGSVWRKNNLTWGYNDRWAEDLGVVAAAAGNYLKLSTPVPPGEVWVLQSISFANNSGVRGICYLGLICGAVVAIVAANPAPAIAVPVLVVGGFALKAGDVAFVQQFAVLLNDNLLAAVTGYKMKVA